MPFCQFGLDWWLAVHNHDDARGDGTFLLPRDVQVGTWEDFCWTSGLFRSRNKQP